MRPRGFPDERGNWEQVPIAGSGLREAGYRGQRLARGWGGWLEGAEAGYRVGPELSCLMGAYDRLMIVDC